jgi:hypothetical protein
MTKSKQVDLLNIGLIIISLLFAYLFPFQLFLLAYAILGPLHYLTEINWLREKNYFVQEKSWVYIALGCALIFVLPLFIVETSLSSLMEIGWIEKIVSSLDKWANGLILLPFVLAMGFAFFKKWRYLMVFLVLGILLAVVLNEFSIYGILIGMILPTVIHVYVFTILFMLFGALKSNSKYGLYAVGLALLVPVLIMSNPVNPENYFFSDLLKETFIENNFHKMNAKLAFVIGQSDGGHFYFYEHLFLKIQIFITFAYTYHYLNWFSKTTIIGWHKQLTRKRSLLIGAIWIAAISLYAFDYRLGLLWLLFLSMLHVFLEFPLNMLSIKGIGDALVKKRT